MKRISHLLVAIIFTSSCFNSISNRSVGTTPFEQEKESNCGKTFTELTYKLEANYVGLALQEKAGSDSLYKSRKHSFSIRAKETEPIKCTSLLSDFLSYFNDGHLSVFERPVYTEKELDTFKQKNLEGGLSISEVDSLMINGKPNELSGKWTDGDSQFYIVNRDSISEAYIIKRSGIEGKIAERKAFFKKTSDGYSVTYYSKSHTPYFMKGGVYKKNTLLSFGPFLWAKTQPDSKIDSSTINSENPRSPTILSLDSATTLVSIPSFLNDHNSFKQFITENKELLENSTNLIIDIRGNRGGNAIYFPLIELFATRDAVANHGWVLSSEDNLQYFKTLKGWGWSKMYSPLIRRMRSNKGEIVDGPKYQPRSYTIPGNSIEKVAILTDEGAISAGESFILHSKAASDKIITFGSPTGGVIDYTSINSIKLIESGRQNIYFSYPTGTLNKSILSEGYNTTGIIPDIPIQHNISDPVDYIMNYLK